MKTIKITILTLALSLCSVATAFAQYSLESNANRPRPGDKLIKQQVGFKDPGRSGKNVMWDFSQLTPILTTRSVLTKPIESIGWDEDITKYLQTVTNSEALVTYFSEDSGRFVAGSDNGNIYHYNPSGDSLLVWGYECPTTRMENTLPELWAAYPFAFKDKLFSYYSGNGIYCDQQDVNVMGSVEVEADAFGMIILPNKDTLDNVLRVRTLKMTIDDRTPLYLKKNGKEVKIKGDSIAQALKLNKKELLKTETIRWYAQGYRYPVFETINTYTDNQGKKSGENLRAFFFQPVDQEQQYLSNDSVNNQIIDKIKKEKNKNKLKSGAEDRPTGIDDLSALRYNIYPNPVETELQVEIYLEANTPVRIALFSLHGNQIYQSPPTKQTGMYRQSISMQSLPKGQYILHIICGNKTITEKIIKK